MAYEDKNRGKDGKRHELQTRTDRTNYTIKKRLWKHEP